MSVYGLWNNKGGVGKSYLTFQIAAEYAVQNPDKSVVVIDLCPQANSSMMLLGGVVDGYKNLEDLKLKTISGYIQERIISPYIDPKKGYLYLTKVNDFNKKIEENLYLIAGDNSLELQADSIISATRSGPNDSWQKVHLWIADLINSVKDNFKNQETTFFIDFNPSFSIYTTIGLSATDNLLIPFTADGSSLRAIRNVISLIYGSNKPGVPDSLFFQNSRQFRMTIPKLYMYIGNRLTQANAGAASAFKSVINDITEEIWNLWKSDSSLFQTHPSSAPTPKNERSFKQMFLSEVNDANTASVYSGVTGIPMPLVTSGPSKNMNGKKVTINQSQLNKQIPNIKELVSRII